MHNSEAMNNHQDSTVLLAAITEQAAILSGCSQQAAYKMLDLLVMTTVKLELLLAIEEEVNAAFNAVN